MNNDIRFELEELTSEAHNLYSLSFALQTALESPNSGNCFTGAAYILSTEMMRFTERMMSLSARVEESGAA